MDGRARRAGTTHDARRTSEDARRRGGATHCQCVAWIPMLTFAGQRARHDRGSAVMVSPRRSDAGLETKLLAMGQWQPCGHGSHGRTAAAEPTLTSVDASYGDRRMASKQRVLTEAAGWRTHADWRQAAAGPDDRGRRECQRYEAQLPWGSREAVRAAPVTASLQLELVVPTRCCLSCSGEADFVNP
jgi:hypothetical protein